MAIRLKSNNPDIFTNPLAMLVTFALKEVGKENVTEDIVKRIKSVLQ